MSLTVPDRVRTSAAYRQEILWSGPCAYCGDLNPTQVDHVIPRSRGGTSDRGNLAPACRSCNLEKLDFTPDEWREWRLSEGLCWPPQSAREVIADLYREFAAKYGRPPHLS